MISVFFSFKKVADPFKQAGTEVRRAAAISPVRRNPPLPAQSETMPPASFTRELPASFHPDEGIARHVFAAP